MLLKKNHSLSDNKYQPTVAPNLRIRFHKLFSISVRILSDLNLWSSHVDNHNCKFIAAITVEYLEDSIIQHFSTPSDSSILSIPSSEMFPELWGLDINVWFMI